MVDVLIRKKKLYITCEFCKYRVTGICKLKNIKKDIDENICDLFEPVLYIYCKYHYLHRDVCINNINIGKRGCRKCISGKIMKLIEKEYLNNS